MRLVQITDCHMSADQKELLHGVNPYNSLATLMRHLAKNLPDAVVMTGDLSNDGSHASYQHISQLTASLSSPIYCIPGNHDDLSYFDKTYPVIKTLDAHWRLLLLNSVIVGQHGGGLDREQVVALEKHIQQNADSHWIIALHHQPIWIGEKGADTMALQNQAEFWERLTPYPQVKIVLCGHIHQAAHVQVGDIQLYATPSSCFQMKSELIWDLSLNPYNAPAYRWLQLYTDGHFETDVHWLT